MVEAWVVLMLYGGGVMSDLSLLDRRGVRRIFGWVRVPNPTTFGRWLRRAAERMVPLLDAMLWHMVRRRRALSGGAPKGWKRPTISPRPSAVATWAQCRPAPPEPQIRNFAGGILFYSSELCWAMRPVI